MSIGADTASFKLVLLGEGCVGKTSLVLRYAEGKFSGKHVTTLQASFLTKRLNLGGTRVTLNIWDTAGQERFHALGPIYYRDSQGALCWCMTSAMSLRFTSWVKELRKICGDQVCLCIVGNKIDLAERERRVSPDEVAAFAESVGAAHCLTSAKLNCGVEEAFLGVARRMLERHQQTAAAAPPAADSARTSGIVLDDDPAGSG
uniref:Ras-related protein Rab-21 n=1 Tax=Macrostomum lignano TaxID=282301 RepID=A0A1I8ICE8_9PLAT